MSFERGEIVWIETKYMFLQNGKLYKSEIHLCRYKAVILGFDSDNDLVAYGSRYLKKLFNLKNKYNFFTTSPYNLYRNLYECLTPGYELNEIIEGVHFLVPTSGLKGWVADKLGVGGYYDQIKLLNYLSNGISKSIPVHTLHHKFHIPTHIIKYVEMDLYNWTNGLDSSSKEITLANLRKL
ncbi:hypothetical protein [Candidatus Thiosymbion oneisti]|uniref:hypothetical protein n=1 Tax=Candidatus Thiosymbion oneisti TaxID=589554 RepID=UPI00114CD035|nr:hypothetical protein [Candidatus Thiosymbion oneisti]